METETQDTQDKISESPSESAPREPTIIFLFDMKNWYETITPLSKLDLFDIAPKVSTQFYMDFGINAYVLILTKSKWDDVPEELRKKFMVISRRVKEEMEGPMQTLARERYEQSDIFELLMGNQTSEASQVPQSVEEPTEMQQVLASIPEDMNPDSPLIDINSIQD